MSEHKKTRYSVEDKLYIVNRNLIDGVGQNKIAKQEGIARSSVNLWVKQYLEGGKEALQNQPPFRRSKIDLSAEADALKRENLLLKIENERLKKGYMVVDGKFVLLKKKNTSSSRT